MTLVDFYNFHEIVEMQKTFYFAESFKTKNQPNIIKHKGNDKLQANVDDHCTQNKCICKL